METVLQYVIKEGFGIFAILFIALLAWVLNTNDKRETRYINDSKERENRYLNVIDCLGEKIDQKVDDLGVRVGCLEKDVADIKATVRRN